MNQQVEDARNTLQKLIAARDEFETSAGKRIRDYIKRLKTNPLFTAGLGRILGVLSTLISEDVTTIKVVLKAVVSGRHIRISFGRKHNVDAMNIYSRIGGSGEFVFTATAPKSPWLDERPNKTAGVTELREFYGMPVSNNKEVGKPSDVVAVNFKG